MQAEDETNEPVLPLLSLDFVKAHAPAVDKSRDTVIQEMENMIFTGLADLVSTSFRARNRRLTQLESSVTLIFATDRTQS